MTEEVRPGGKCKTPADKREVSISAEERLAPALAAFCGAYGSGMIPKTAGIFLAG